MDGNTTESTITRELSSEQIRQQERLFNGFQSTIKKSNEALIKGFAVAEKLKQEQLRWDIITCAYIGLFLFTFTPLRAVWVGLFKTAEITSNTATDLIDLATGGTKELDMRTLKKGDEVRGKGNKTYVVTSPYGPRSLGYGSTFHRGVDINTLNGVPLYAITTSPVTTTCHYEDRAGKYLKMDLSINGDTYTVKLLHLSSCHAATGVTGGQMIAWTGNTGYVNRGGAKVNVDPHLHFAVDKNGESIDPPRGLLDSLMLGVPIKNN